MPSNCDGEGERLSRLNKPSRLRKDGTVVDAGVGRWPPAISIPWMDSPLRSERQGRGRSLSADGFMALLWKRIAHAGRAGLFSRRFRAHFDITDAVDEVEEYLLLTLRTGDAKGIASRLIANSTNLPIVLESNPLDTPAHEADRLDLILDLVELLHNDVVTLPADDGESDLSPDERMAAGQDAFRQFVNPALAMHSPPLELLPIGHIVEQDAERRELYVQPLPTDSERQVSEPVTAAKNLFLKRGATVDDKRAAVQALAGALEHLRPEVKEALVSKDEAALFEIANGFAIRHNNRQQKADYDSEVWLDWIFHVYLATVHLIVGLRDRPGQVGLVR